MIDKFKDDKVFIENDSLITILDGVILNKKSLMDKYKSGDWSNLVSFLYKQNGETFFDEFRGSFAGALYDKVANKWVIYGDQLGTKFIYYTRVGEFFACSQVMGNMYTILKDNNINYHIDEDGAIMLLTYGFMLKDYTLCQEVRKIQPGCYIVYENDTVTEKNYYKLSNTPDYSITDDEAIEGIDRFFRQAVKRQFNKDDEYGYKHLCALSAGLDCRMTSFVANDLGYRKQLNITFSQSEYYDDVVSKSMAVDMGHDWLYKTLDNGIWLYDVDDITLITGGNVVYYGSAHGNSLFKLMNFKEYGLLHSGQMGDVALSTHSKVNCEEFELGDGAYSRKFLKDLSIDCSDAPNKEIGMWYYRYLNGTNNGQQNEYNYTETFSPFTDLDFLEYVLSIPAEFRFNHKIYKKWIMKKYPLSAKYIWTGNNSKIYDRTYKIHGNELTMAQIMERIKSKINPHKTGYWNAKFNMDPIGYYLSTQTSLVSFLDGYFSYVGEVNSKCLRNSLNKIKTAGSPIEKIEACSLLSAIKLYFTK